MSPQRPEFSRIVSLAQIGADPFRQEIAATEAERDALARRFDLFALDRLAAEVESKPLRVSGSRDAGRLTQVEPPGRQGLKEHEIAAGLDVVHKPTLGRVRQRCAARVQNQRPR
jgi:hypothetical protein